MNVKKKGTDFENKVVQMLYENGFWVHRMQDNKNGQPFDVIATKGNRFYGFECKTAAKVFDLKRLEQNQRYSCKALHKAHTTNIFVVVGYDDGNVAVMQMSAMMDTGRMLFRYSDILSLGGDKFDGNYIKQNYI